MTQQIYYNIEKQLPELKKRFNIRWKSIEKRFSFPYKNTDSEITLPDKKELWQYLLQCYENGFKCEYCGRQMLIKDSISPYGKSFSFDHKQSVFCGGNNNIQNFAVVCHRCNIIKGVMSEKTFRQLIEILPLDLKEKMFNEIYAGRLADKLQREDSLSLEKQLWAISKIFNGWLPPQCSYCLGYLSQKTASNNLTCLTCGKEFTLTEVFGDI